MLLNLTVVYFAFGAPLGVYGVIRNKGTSPHELVFSLFRFLFWPLFAAASVRGAFVFQPAHDSLERKIDALRAEFEVEIDRVSLSEFRDVFARYTGLAVAAANATDNNAAAELMKIAGNSSSPAEACHARRNRRRLESHLVLARNEFAYLTTANENARTRELCAQLRALLDE